MALEWYWWVIIGVSVAVVGVVLYMVLFTEEEMAGEEAVEESGVDIVISSTNQPMCECIVDLNDTKVLAALKEEGMIASIGSVAYLEAWE